MKVYLLEVAGVFATLEAAMKAGTPTGETFVAGGNGITRPIAEHAWRSDGNGGWVNNGDWDDAAEITWAEVQE